MGEFDNIQMQGEKRDRALEAFHKQASEWGLKMPEATTLVADFGLGRFSEVGETEVWIANDESTGYCGKFVFVMDGQTCPYHRHKTKHETFFIVKGSMRMKMSEGEILMREGDLLPMPPGKWHSFTGIGPCLVLEVSKPSIVGDNEFEDTNIGNNGVV